jgi:hypothetical protein
MIEKWVIVSGAAWQSVTPEAMTCFFQFAEAFSITCFP